MIPPQIIAGVGAIISTAYNVGIGCDQACRRYKHAPRMIRVVRDEVRSVKASLEQLKIQIKIYPERYQSSETLTTALEGSLATCSYLLVMLSKDFRVLTRMENSVTIGRMQKINIVWNDDGIQEFLGLLQRSYGSMKRLMDDIDRYTLNTLQNYARSHSTQLDQILVYVRGIAEALPRPQSGQRLSRIEDLDCGSIFNFRALARSTPSPDGAGGVRRRNNAHPPRAPVPPSRPPYGTSASMSRTVDPVARPLMLRHRASPILRPEAEPQAALLNPRPPGDIFQAVRTRNYPLLEHMIDIKTDLSLRDESMHSALSLAVHMGDTKACQKLIEGGSGVEAPCDAWNCHRSRPLHIAAGRNDVQVLQLLLSKGARIDSTSNGEETALHWAAKYDAANATEVLLSVATTSSLNLAWLASRHNSSGDTPVHLAIRARASLFIQALFRHPDMQGNGVIEIKNGLNQRPLQLAVESGWLDGAALLVSHGANSNMKDAHGATLLHVAAQKGSHEAIQFLINAGIDVDARDSWGLTPLHYCVRSKYDSRRTIRVLLDAGANLHARCHPEVHGAIKTQIGRSLESMMPAPTATNLDPCVLQQGPTPFLLAARVSTGPVVSCLLDAGADLQDQNICGSDALTVARSNANTEVFLLLFLREMSYSHPLEDKTLYAKMLALMMVSDADFRRLRKLPPQQALGVDCGCSLRSSAVIQAVIGACQNARVSIHARYRRRSALRRAVLGNFPTGVRLILQQDSTPSAYEEIEYVYDRLRDAEDAPSRAEEEILALLSQKLDTRRALSSRQGGYIGDAIQRLLEMIQEFFGISPSSRARRPQQQTRQDSRGEQRRRPRSRRRHNEERGHWRPLLVVP